MTIVTNRLWRALQCCVCAGIATAAMAASDSLYVRLGQEPGVTAIATALIDRVAANPITGPNFKDSKLDRIKELLAEQICDLSGGPCRYSGDPMKEVHAGHHISEAMFYVMVDTLRDVMKERHIDMRSRNELLRLLAPMKRDVVEHVSGKAIAPIKRQALPAR